MKRAFWKISVCSLVSLGALMYGAHAQNSGTVAAPAQSSSVPTFGGNPQHTSIYQPAAQNLNRIIWSTDIDLHDSFGGAHYSPPVITAANTVVIPVKTATDGFVINALNSSGGVLYTLP